MLSAFSRTAVQSGSIANTLKPSAPPYMCEVPARKSSCTITYSIIPLLFVIALPRDVSETCTYLLQNVHRSVRQCCCPCVPLSRRIHTRTLERLARKILYDPTICRAYGETLILCAISYTRRCLQASAPKSSRAFNCEDSHSIIYTSCVWVQTHPLGSRIVFKIVCAPSRTGERIQQNVRLPCTSNILSLTIYVA